MKDVDKGAPSLQTFNNKHSPNGHANALHPVPTHSATSKTAMNPKMKKAPKKNILKAQLVAQQQSTPNVPFTISRSGSKPPQLSQKKPALHSNKREQTRKLQPDSTVINK